MTDDNHRAAPLTYVLDGWCRHCEMAKKIVGYESLNDFKIKNPSVVYRNYFRLRGASDGAPPRFSVVTSAHHHTDTLFAKIGPPSTNHRCCTNKARKDKEDTPQAFIGTEADACRVSCVCRVSNADCSPSQHCRQRVRRTTARWSCRAAPSDARCRAPCAAATSITSPATSSRRNPPPRTWALI